MKMRKILVTGGCGQIGSELVMELRGKYGGNNVIAADHKRNPGKTLVNSGPVEFIDVTNRQTVEDVIRDYEIDTIYHMAALLSAVGEKNPDLCWNVNMNGLRNILEIARKYDLIRVFFPSSVAVFGPGAPRYNTPQETILRPTTIYGITKVAGELLCEWYFNRFGLDVRGIRYPGIISSETPPGGGTTDYAVAIFHEAIQQKSYTCFLKEDTVLPMMYIPDCIRATVELMEADLARLKHHSNFNLTATSFSPGQLAAEIKKHIPEFTCAYKPDFRQEIAESWPRSIDDSAAREEWGWRPEYDLSMTVKDMLKKLEVKQPAGKSIGK